MKQDGSTPNTNHRRWAAGWSVLPLLTAGCGQALAADDNVLANPPLAQIVRSAEPAGGVQASAAAPAPGEAILDLRVQYTDGQIYNPASGRFDQVKLRAYHGGKVDPAVPFVAPTIEIHPGETVRMTLDNALPVDPLCYHGQAVDTPHCFNATNMHTHGLWISPTGNSDNVLLTLNPNTRFEYEYNIPPDHPAGTFWYHPHRHGSTALQVSSGMAGALIIRGDRPPTPQRNGDIDTLLRQNDGNPFRERVLLLQQVQYACRDADGQIKVKKNDEGEVIAWVCDPGDVGGIESYDQFGPGTWPASGRHTSINGRIMPIVGGTKAGDVQRWRLIHAGVRDSIHLRLRKLEVNGDAKPFARLKASEQAEWVSQHCTGDDLPQWIIANDGLTRDRIVKADTAVLQPGYRVDILAVFPTAGRYCVIDDAVTASGSVSGESESRRLLGVVEVAAGETVDDVDAYLQTVLVEAAEQWMPEDMRQHVAADLMDGLRLDAFIPHPTIEAAEVTGQQTLAFNIDTSQSPATFEVDGKPYDPDRVDRMLKLNGVDQWVMTSQLASHPFHIHVNPFQVVDVLGPDGEPVTGDDEHADPDYAGMKGTWKDTIFVKSGYQVITRTRYQRYIGEFVLHCHILDHEDQGMMQNVSVVLSDGTGGLSPMGHH